MYKGDNVKIDIPLEHYDREGKLKPPVVLYAGALFLCRGVLILLASLSTREHANGMMKLLYPNRMEFFLSLLPAVLGIVALILMSKRKTFWAKERYQYFKYLLPIFCVAFVIDLLLQLFVLYQVNFSVSPIKLVFLVLTISLAMYLFTDSHVKALTKDWQTPV